MPIEFGSPDLTELTPRIAVIGVGGAGCNAVNNMIAAQLQGVDFIVANTDAQSLSDARADTKIQLGANLTQGLGAGAQPKVGQQAAEESVEQIDALLDGCHMAFITAGMGGGTGTGAAPVIASRAREKGVLTVGVVTRPFQFEGGRRAKIAEAGLQALASEVDTLIIIPNQNLFRVANERTTFAEAFNMADEVLHSGVRGITDLMVSSGLINLDFADVQTVMQEMGKAMMGTGEAEGETRAQEAAAAAISNPLLEEASLLGAKGVIINVTGGLDITLFEVNEAVNMVREQADPDALIVFGSAFNEELTGRIRVSVVATGIEGGAATAPIAGPGGREQTARSAGFDDALPGTAASATGSSSAADTAADSGSNSDEKSSASSSGEADDAVAKPAAAYAAATGGSSDDDAAASLEEKALAKSTDGFIAQAPKQPAGAAYPMGQMSEVAGEPMAGQSPGRTSEEAPQRAPAHAGDNDMGGAPEAKTGRRTAAGPDPVAKPFEEAAYISGAEAGRAGATTTPEEKADKPQHRTLFQVVRSSLTGKSSDGATSNPDQAAPENHGPAMGATTSAGGSDDAAEDGLSANPDDRPVPAAREQQLEIPSFLRRQQN